LLYDEQVLAYEFSGRRHDCGSKLGYLIATVEYGLRHPELGERFRTYLQAFGCQFGDSTPSGTPFVSDQGSAKGEGNSGSL
jgi:UTP--glucose-1-phosphate uridylyltransferase